MLALITIIKTKNTFLDKTSQLKSQSLQNNLVLQATFDMRILEPILLIKNYTNIK